MDTLFSSFLSDAIQYLKDSYDPKDSLLVSKEFIASSPKTSTLIKQELKQIEPIVQTPLAQPQAPRIKITKPPKPLQPQELEAVVETTPPSEEWKESFLPFEDLVQKIRKKFPAFSVETETLSDYNGLLPVLTKDVLILSFREGKESDLFLLNVGNAIERSFSSTGVWNATKCDSQEDVKLLLEMGQAKLIISSPKILQHPLFLTSIKEIPSTASRFLGKSTLLLLEPFDHYFTNPLQKKILWQTICTHLNTQALSQTKL